MEIEEGVVLGPMLLKVILKPFIFLLPPPRGVGVKNFNWKFAQNLVFLYVGKVKKFNPNPTGGGAYLPHKFSNAYSSGTESRIDLKPGCKFEFIRCLEV